MIGQAMLDMEFVKECPEFLLRRTGKVCRPSEQDFLHLDVAATIDVFMMGGSHAANIPEDLAPGKDALGIISVQTEAVEVRLAPCGPLFEQEGWDGDKTDIVHQRRAPMVHEDRQELRPDGAHPAPREEGRGS